MHGELILTARACGIQKRKVCEGTNDGQGRGRKGSVETSGNGEAIEYRQACIPTELQVEREWR